MNTKLKRALKKLLAALLLVAMVSFVMNIFFYLLYVPNDAEHKAILFFNFLFCDIRFALCWLFYHGANYYFSG